MTVRTKDAALASQAIEEAVHLIDKLAMLDISFSDKIGQAVEQAVYRGALPLNLTISSRMEEERGKMLATANEVCQRIATATSQSVLDINQAQIKAKKLAICLVIASAIGAGVTTVIVNFFLLGVFL